MKYLFTARFLASCAARQSAELPLHLLPTRIPSTSKLARVRQHDKLLRLVEDSDQVQVPVQTPSLHWQSSSGSGLYVAAVSCEICRSFTGKFSCLTLNSVVTALCALQPGCCEAHNHNTVLHATAHHDDNIWNPDSDTPPYTDMYVPACASTYWPGYIGLVP
jgi:hypothetical protein